MGRMGGFDTCRNQFAYHSWASFGPKPSRHLEVFPSGFRSWPHFVLHFSYPAVPHVPVRQLPPSHRRAHTPNKSAPDNVPTAFVVAAISIKRRTQKALTSWCSTVVGGRKGSLIIIIPASKEQQRGVILQARIVGCLSLLGCLLFPFLHQGRFPVLPCPVPPRQRHSSTTPPNVQPQRPEVLETPPRRTTPRCYLAAIEQEQGCCPLRNTKPRHNSLLTTSRDRSQQQPAPHIAARSGFRAAGIYLARHASS
jgi:hypothetical protein